LTASSPLSMPGSIKRTKGTPVFVKHGKTQYSAMLIGTPSPDDVQDGMVRIRWDSGGKENVLWQNVIEIDQLRSRRRRKTQRLGWEVEGASLDEDKLSSPVKDELSSPEEDELSSSEEDKEGASSDEDELSSTEKDELSSTEEDELSSSEDNKGSISEELENKKNASKENAASALNNIPGFDPVEVDIALDNIGPPFGLQTAMKQVIELRQRKMIKDGFKIRKFFSGVEHNGSVVGWPFRENKGTKLLHWLVRYTDNDEETMSYDDLMRWRADRPHVLATCRGRPLQMLELFCGSAVVTQEFAQLKWKTESIDISEESNATTIVDILELAFGDLRFVPDFIWASLPCETYSCAPGNYHRSTKTCNLDKSKKAREHNFIFLQMTKIMEWAKEKHPHLIIVIENPVGTLKKMPLMEEFTEKFGLYSTTVNYCAFGRDEMKPTVIWTNDWGLKTSLQDFTCKKKCQLGKGHHIGGFLDRNDCGVIPQPLAEEVAEYVNAKFFMDRIRKRKAALLNDEED